MEYRVDNLIDFPNWEDFLEGLEDVKKWREDKKQEMGGKYVPKLIFRGQADSNWHLKTTLERLSWEKKYSIDEYYRKILKARYEIESFTKETWKLPTPSCYSNLVEELRPFTHHKHLFPSRYDVAPYFLYLRHHGFPSPMLDWTVSPYIAAYFAFEGQVDPLKNVSIFIFLESITGLSGRGDAPTIHTLGRNVKSHERHFLQQCEYTFCLQVEVAEKYFASHVDAFKERPSDQQYIWKCDIPSTERKKVLKILDSVNINRFSLFGSIESLMASTAERYFFLED